MTGVHRAGRRAGVDRAGFDHAVTDRGTTLVEMIVTIMITGVLLSMFGTSLLSLTKAVRRQTASIDAQQATRDAFLLLDKQIRYADAVSSPATIGANQWIEWRVPDPAILVATSATQSRCFQWQASSSARTLQYRTWIVPTSGGVAVPAWRPVADRLVIGTQPVFTTTPSALRAAPFSLPASGSVYGYPYAQVGIALSIVDGSDALGRASSSTVFTALNSSATPASVCTEVPRS